jgi:tRNA modification GTPase
MKSCDLNDTIVAISTPPGESGIGIVRISGKEALKVADKIFLSRDNRKSSEFKTYTTHYGWIMDKREIVDEVILTVMRAPRSYTKEDIIEINCHGGIVALRRVLDLVVENGCRLASPGEFTKRAFLNGRIDLAQAEAVLDVIRAKTDSALKVGAEQLRGRLSSQVNKMRKVLLDILSMLEANIDFPEEEIRPAEFKDIAQRLNHINNEMKSLLEAARFGRILREGIHVVICGRPNVGKSSLLNALLKQERSIVTAIPGTTRDTIEEVIDIKGIPIRIVDTAGILEPRDLIEKKAVQRSRRYIDLADLVILLFDGSERLSREDEVLMRKLRKKVVIAAINKTDLKQKIERGKILKRFKLVLDISAKKFKNINLLEEAIANAVYKGRVRSSDSVMVSNLRHIVAIKEAQKLIAEAINSLDNKLSSEFIAQDIKEALSCLDNILGKKFSEDLLDKIFSQFCIGK